MVDNRSAGFYGIGGAFNFKSGDISGTAAKTGEEKMGQGSEYFLMRNNEDNEEANDATKYTDRSAVLRATLNSLAMMNVANVINSKKKSIDDSIVHEISSEDEQQEHQSENKENDEQLEKDLIETQEDLSVEVNFDIKG